MIPALLLAIGASAAAFAVTIAVKQHLEPRPRRELAFVLALTVASVTLGGALLLAVIGDLS